MSRLWRSEETPLQVILIGTGYDYPDLPGLGNNNEKLGLPERLSTGIQFRFRNEFHGKQLGNRNLSYLLPLTDMSRLWRSEETHALYA
jgi:hypothetical protein